MIKIKIAVLSDIHGNYIALEEVLKDTRLNNVDEYFVIGDMINDMPFGNKTLDMVKSITDVVLKGNKEQYLIEFEGAQYNWSNKQFIPTIYMYHELSKENLEYIKQLPHKMDLVREGVKITIAHGSPKSVEEKIDRDDKLIKEYYAKNINSDILIFGHTHEKIWTEEIGGKVLVNAGCLGVSPNYIGKAEYIILEVENGKIINIEPRLVDYDIEKVKNAIIESGILNLEKTLMNLTYCGIDGHGIVRYNFFREGRKKMIEKYGRWYKKEATGIYQYFMLFDDDIWDELGEKYKEFFVFK